MEAYGASAEQIEAVRARIDAARTAAEAEQSAFGVYAENLPVVAAFEALAPRWQYLVMDRGLAGCSVHRAGFDWVAVEAWIDRHCRRRQRRALSRDLQVMERAVLAADREQLDKKERE